MAETKIRSQDLAVAAQTEIDFGATPVAFGEFTVTDATVTAGSIIVGSMAYQAPTGKDLDELEFDTLILQFQPGAGQLVIRAHAADGGLVADKFKVNYIVA